MEETVFGDATLETVFGGDGFCFLEERVFLTNESPNFSGGGEFSEFALFCFRDDEKFLRCPFFSFFYTRKKEERNERKEDKERKTGRKGEKERKQERKKAGKQAGKKEEIG